MLLHANVIGDPSNKSIILYTDALYNNDMNTLYNDVTLLSDYTYDDTDESTYYGIEGVI